MIAFQPIRDSTALVGVASLLEGRNGGAGDEAADGQGRGQAAQEVRGQQAGGGGRRRGGASLLQRAVCGDGLALETENGGVFEQMNEGVKAQLAQVLAFLQAKQARTQ